MKITYIHQHFVLPSEPGGTRPWEFARRLSRDGHEVTVIGGAAHPSRQRVEGFTLERVRAPYANRMSFNRRLWSFAQFMTASTRLARRLPADVVLASSTPLTTAIPGRLGAKAQRAPFVLEVRDVWPLVPIELGYLTNPVLIQLAEWLERWAYAGARDVIALSPGMKEQITSRFPDLAVHVVPNAADRELFATTPDARTRIREELGWSSPTVVYAGSLGRSYEPSWLAQVAVELTSHGIDMKIAGSGEQLAIAREIIDGAGLSADDVLLGPTPKSDVARLLMGADAAISSLVDEPSLEGNSLNKVFDAMATGRYTFFNHGGWLQEICTSHGAGERVSRDPHAAAKQISQTLSNMQALTTGELESATLGQTRFDRDFLYSQFASILTSGHRQAQRPPTTKKSLR